VDGFTVCQSCGIVYDKIYDDSPQRTFNAEDIKKKRICEPVYSPFGPRTTIRGNRDSKGRLLSAEFKTKFSRLGKIHRSLTSSYERNLWIALPKFHRIEEQLGIPEPALKDAIRIYKEAVKERLTMGRSIKQLIAGSIYVSMKLHEIPRVVEEIQKAVNVEKKKVIKVYRILLFNILPKLNLKVTHLSPSQYIDKFGQDLDLPMKVRQDALKILQKARKNGLLIEGKDPNGVAAAGIYISANLHKIPRTQRDIAKIAHVTEVTLRVRSRDLKKYCRIVRYRKNKPKKNK
jgi:transcription initiation factor TFIIB